MKAAYIIKQVLGYIFIAYALVGMGYSLILTFDPFSEILTNLKDTTLFNAHYIDKFGDRLTSNVILLFGLSAIAGAILLTGNNRSNNNSYK
jgi:glycerol uptake facilitator-like aquaporin